MNKKDINMDLKSLVITLFMIITISFLSISSTENYNNIYNYEDQCVGVYKLNKFMIFGLKSMQDYNETFKPQDPILICEDLECIKNNIINLYKENDIIGIVPL